MNNAVFTYGSLMFDEVWERVVRGDYRKSAAVLYGFRLHSLRNETFPAIIRGAATDRIHGYIYTDLEASDWQRLDDFEGDYYRRETVVVSTADIQQYPAMTYVLRDEYFMRLEKTGWDAEAFRSEHLADFIAHHF